MKLHNLISKEKDIRMLWKVEKNGKKSSLVGTAHFFPYSFKRSLMRHIGSADVVLLEGPLDESSMSRVVDCGLQKGGGPSLYEALDKETIIKIRREFAHPRKGLSSMASYMDLFKPKTGDVIDSLMTLKPWMAFFSVWFLYLEKRGWKFKMDYDALRIVQELGKEVFFLERIEEQIEALEGIPLEGIVQFLRKIGQWESYAKEYVKCYLKGSLNALMSIASEFPSRCTTVIDKRDPILYERMRVFFEKGNAIAFVGAPHVKEIKKMLLGDGYEVAQFS